MQRSTTRSLSRRARDTALAAFALGIAALLAIGSSGLPPPRFEPMGSAAVPRILAALIALFALLILAKAWTRREAVLDAGPADEVVAPPGRSLAAFAALVAYVAALDFAHAPFIPTTVAFVLVMGLTLAARTRRTLLGFALLGLILAVGIDMVFTRFLYVDLG